MKNGKYGFAVIGLGSIGLTHAKAIGELEDGYLAAVYNPTWSKTGSFCKDRPGVHGCRTLEELLADPDVDIVTIASPSGAHLEPALAAINAGKHVISEKPLEITTERIDELIAAAKEKGVMLSCIFQSRFYEASQLVKKAIDEGRLGQMTLCDAQIKWFRSQEYYDSVGWRGTWKLDGGGALMNQGIHAIDLLQWFCGPVKEVTGYIATLGHSNIEVEDTAAASLRFASGALGTIEGSTAVYPGFLKKLEILGTEGSIILEEDSLKAWVFRDERPEDEEIRKRFASGSSSGGAADPKAINYRYHMKCFEDAIDALKSGRSPLISGEEARKSVEIIRAIYRSSETGMSVKL